MKITSIEIHPDNSSEVIVLSFRDPKNINEYNIKNITGLDASSLSSRTIAMLIGLNPTFMSYATLRDNFYKIIASSRTGLVQLQFINGTTVVAAISGFVAKLEALQFDKIPEVTLTVQCDDPLIRSLDHKTEAVNGHDLGVLNIIDNASTAPHGFITTVSVSSNIGAMKINSPTDSSWSFEVVPSGGFLAGDVLYLSTEINNKSIYNIRDGNYFPLADVVVPGSSWPLLFPGTNVFAFTNASSLNMTQFLHYLTYWGV